MNFLARSLNALLDSLVKLRLVRVATLHDLDERMRLLGEQREAAQAERKQLHSDLEEKTARITFLEEDILRLEGEISRLEELLRQQGELQRNSKPVEQIMDVEGSHEMQSRIISLGRMLRPKKALRYDKIRIGAQADGGYILLNDLRNVSTVLSLGIAHEISFDLQLAEMGAQVFQFDHSVEGPPVQHDRFTFEKVKIVADTKDNGRTLGEIARKHCTSDKLNILKIDVEADEWPILDATPTSALASFSQIVCEFHWFSQIVSSEEYDRALRVLEKLGTTFEIVHVHANNFGGFSLKGNVPFPEVMEITFAAKNRYEFREISEFLPTALDAPNNPKSPDLWLGRFEF